MGMAGKDYSSQNKNRLKTIPLGSGNVYVLPVNSTYPTMPTDQQFETDANMIGRTKNGATLTYSSEIYVAKSDDGVAKKQRITEETVTFSWGIMTWIPATIQMLLQTAVATSQTGYDEVKIGGVGNQTNQEYWVHFVGGDDIDGKITVTGRGLNNSGLEAAFANDSESVLTPTFDFSPMDSNGTLVVIKTAKMTAQGDTAPQLTALTVGALTLSPTFASGTYEYTASSSSSSAAVTATAPSGSTLVITVNGNSIANGGTASFDEGENEIVINLSTDKGNNTYKVTVTYES